MQTDAAINIYTKRHCNRKDCCRMATKKGKSSSGNKPHGHFCKVCGEHKANEKFSGRGHAAHICKACAGLPVTERNEMMTIRKIEGMAFRHLSEQEIKWLRNHMKDSRTDVREAAINAHQIKFPHYERNIAKKGMTAFSLELYIHDEICNDWGDAVCVNARVRIDQSGLLRYIDYALPEGQQEHETRIEPKEAKRFLKAVVHELNAPFWGEDYSDGTYNFDPYLDVLPEYRPDFFDDDIEEDEDEGEDDEPADQPEEREPLWSILLELNTGEDKEIVFYNNMTDAAAELFWLLMEYFEPDEEPDDYDELI